MATLDYCKLITVLKKDRDIGKKKIITYALI
jgi:hypothetical protein